MTDEDMVLVQRIRFTGGRTHLESVSIKGIGRIAVGQTIEVSLDEAERYTTMLPTRDGEATDFEKVGGEYAVAQSEIAERRMVQGEKNRAAATIDVSDVVSEDPVDVETPVLDSEPVADEHDAAVESETKKGRTKKE
jgi:hypothetical protein